MPFLIARQLIAPTPRRTIGKIIVWRMAVTYAKVNTSCAIRPDGKLNLVPAEADGEGAQQEAAATVE